MACCVQQPWSKPIRAHPALLCVAALFLIGADLPNSDLPDNVPIPVPRPKIDAAQDAGEQAPQDKEKLPEKSPDQSGQDEDTPDSEAKDEVDTYVPPPIETEDPAAYKTCLADLEKLGVQYKEAPRIDDGNGCGIDKPIIVTSIGNDVALKPEGEMRCETARQLAEWAANSVTPMLKVAKPDETLAGLDQASTYICRKRNNAETGKISEHAHGNAVDIAGLRFKSGASFSIKPRMKDSTMDGALQRAITSAACLYFTTVLDPGSDKAHETHLHLDVIKRKAGYRYCW